MVIVAQLVRAPVCGTGGRGFEPRPSPILKPDVSINIGFFYTYLFHAPNIFAL